LPSGPFAFAQGSSGALKMTGVKGSFYAALTGRSSTKHLTENPILDGQASVKGMYQFAIDMGEENSYTPAAPKGVEGEVL
jgi:hypothetical protein